MNDLPIGTIIGGLVRLVTAALLLLRTFRKNDSPMRDDIRLIQTALAFLLLSSIYDLPGVP